MTLQRSRVKPTILTIGPLILLAATSCVPVTSAAVRPTAAPFAAPVEAALARAEAERAMDPAIAAHLPVPEMRPALPFESDGASDADRARSLQCLASAVYYEAASESLDGQRAVAQVVLNRVRHPAFPNSVCGVVYQGSQRSTGCQFTFTCDGSLRRRPEAAAWDRARQVAEEALSGEVYAPVGQATHYHTRAVLPYWSHSLTRAAMIGSHIFYRWRGAGGEASAFRQAYAGMEPFAAAEAPSRAPLEQIARDSTVWEGDGETVTIHRGLARRVEARRVETPAEASGVRIHRGAAPEITG